MAYLASVTTVKLWYLLPFLKQYIIYDFGKKKNPTLYLVQLTSIEKNTYTLKSVFPS